MALSDCGDLFIRWESEGRTMISWIIMVFATIGAMVVSVISGFFLFDEFIGLWPEPVVGFITAFLVVATAYITAPKYPVIISGVVLLLGSFVSWKYLSIASYPEWHELAYQQTYIPLFTTLLGGVIGALVIICYGQLILDNCLTKR